MTTSESADNFVVCLTFTPEGITCTFAEERKYLLAIFQVKMAHATRESVLQLIAQKDKIEDDLRELFDVLKKNNTDMDQPLVDSEGYPRADIDVYQVRLVRHQIICVRNDLKDITKKIEEALHELHAEAREGLGLNVSSQSHAEDITNEDFPFARIRDVITGSPADKAGLKHSDLILKFGTIRAKNFNSLHDIASVVKHRENSEIPLVVKRLEKIVSVTLVPKAWSGQGLLGCTLLPHDNVDR